jgi:tRNA threonylcarbamoyl adenosine modification protein YeaZ
MKILALEFSSPVRAVAARGGLKAGYAEESGQREARPFRLIEAALKQAGMSRDDVECIAVGLGPGSHAGIRTAIAIAQGWQMARGIKLLGFSSADVVAASAGQWGQHWICVGLEVRTGELFVAHYDVLQTGPPVMIEPFRPLTGEVVSSGPVYRMDWPARQPPDAGFVSLPPNAAQLAAMAESGTAFLSGDKLAPIYLRSVEFVRAPAPRFTAD